MDVNVQVVHISRLKEADVKMIHKYSYVYNNYVTNQLGICLHFINTLIIHISSYSMVKFKQVSRLLSKSGPL